MLMLWLEQAFSVLAQLLAVLARQSTFCPPFVHGSVGPSTVLIARSSGDAPGDGVAWARTGAAGEAQRARMAQRTCRPPRTGAALTHLTTLASRATARTVSSATW
jgi:hypothetical protein